MQFTVITTGIRAGTPVPVVTIDNPLAVRMDGPIDTSVPGSYTVKLKAAVGTFLGRVSFDLCTDQTCVTKLTGMHQEFRYKTNLFGRAWVTYQGNAAHTGFVDAVFDPAAFHEVWRWTRPPGDNEPIGGINSVVTTNDTVVVTKDIYNGQAAVYGVGTTSGALQWTYPLGPQASEGPATVAHGNIYVPIQDGNEQTFLVSFTSATRTPQFTWQMGGQWQNFYSPVPTQDSILPTASDGLLHAFRATDGSSPWAAPVGAQDMQAATVDGVNAYVYGVNSADGKIGLQVIDLATGSKVAAIPDPFVTSFSSYDAFSAPILGNRGHVLSYSDGGFSGHAASSSEQYAPRILVNYDVYNRTVAWRSAQSYLTQPALANGVVYVARNQPPTLDALDETDGHVLWSWPMPSGAGDTGFHRNTVVTRNLVFVSTDAHIYAIDLKTHRAVWSLPIAGMLAISGDSVLLVATGAQLSDGRLVAIRLY
jgi:outer membrane protein assembly factor BamB